MSSVLKANVLFITFSLDNLPSIFGFFIFLLFQNVLRFFFVFFLYLNQKYFCMENFCTL